MNSLKYKLLISFCVLALFSIALVGGVVSLMIRKSISQQAEQLADDMTGRTYETLNLPHQTFELLIRNEVCRNANDLRTSATLAANFESDRLKSLQAELYTNATERNLDLIVLFDLQGRIAASFPLDMNTLEVERFMQSWPFGTHILLNASQSETAKIWETFARHDSQNLAFWGLSERDVAGKGALSFMAAGMVMNDFDEPLGICLVGKLLNQYAEPLQHLNDIAGYASVIYLGTTAIAQAGFASSDDDDVDLATLEIPPEIETEVFRSSDKINRILTIAGQSYLTACSAIHSFAQEPIGMLCVGLPRANLMRLRDSITNAGDGTIRKVQGWIVRIGIISLALFALVSMGVAGRIVKPLLKSIDFAKSVTSGNLVATIDMAPQDEVGMLVRTLKGMSAHLREMVIAIKHTADDVASGSQEMNLQAEQISQGANEQAAVTEEASLSIEQMAAAINRNTENAGRTEDIARQLVEDAQLGGTAVTEAVDAMRKIARKIAVVEDIANQTRILSLNATIEAARAQEYGKGFNVVAAEVRALSERTRQAVIEINQLAHSSVNIAEKAGDMLKSLVPDIQKTAEVVQEISAASREQNLGAKQISKAMQQLDTITQQNLAAIETMATTAQELSALADQLQQAVAFFRIENP